MNIFHLQNWWLDSVFKDSSKSINLWLIDDWFSVVFMPSASPEKAYIVLCAKKHPKQDLEFDHQNKDAEIWVEYEVGSAVSVLQWI